MHTYAFGSLCRGDVALNSDVDLLALVEGIDQRFDPDVFSIYSYGRVKELWKEGNPFAWHLALEARLVYASDGIDYLRALGQPGRYEKCLEDCEKFTSLFRAARQSLEEGNGAAVFDLSTIFLSIRNIASCYSLGVTPAPLFGRHAALGLGAESIVLPRKCYDVLERARILSTRGHGRALLASEIAEVKTHFGAILNWMNMLTKKASQCMSSTIA